jgi:small subunit ribosomal protein S20
MPNSNSSKKRLRQNKVHQLRNNAVKTKMRGLIRKVRTAITAGDVDESKTTFQAAIKKIDQAAGKNVIHANKAARTKSRLSKAIKSLQAK